MSTKGFFDYFPPPLFLQMPYVGLDISPRAIRFVEFIHKEGVLHPHRLVEKPLSAPVLSYEDIGRSTEVRQILKDLVREYKISFVKASLPEDTAYLFKTEVIGQSDKDIRSSVEFTLEENVPIAGEEMLFDAHVIKRLPEGKVGVTVTALPKKVIDTYVDLFKECGIVPLSFMLQPTAVSRAVIKKGDMAAYMVVDIGDAKTVISIISEGALQFTSTLAIGGNNFDADIAKSLNKTVEEVGKIKSETLKEEERNEMLFAVGNTLSILKDEIDRVYLYWHTHKEKNGEYGKKINKIVLVGEDVSLYGMKDHLSRSVRIPVEVANVWQNAFSFDDEIPSVSLERSLSFAAAVGLALPKSKY